MPENQQNTSENPAPEATPQAVPNNAQPQPPTSQQPVVQQVVVEKTNVGVGGWLMFFVICLGIAAFSYLMLFFTALAALVSSPNANNIFSVLMAPVVAGTATAAIVMIAMRKKLGKWLAIGTYAAGFLYFAITTIINVASDCSREYASWWYVTNSCTAEGWILAFGSIVGAALVAGLVSLYYLISKRVKATLTE